MQGTTVERQTEHGVALRRERHAFETVGQWRVACDLDAMKAERLYYLRRMNAWTPPAVNTPGSVQPGKGSWRS